MTKDAAFNEIEITPGVMTSSDATASDIPCWTFTKHVRFDSATGRIRKLKGWLSNTFDYGNTIAGTIRTIFSATINQKVYTAVGTNSALYSLIGSSLTNITPLQTTTVAAANSLATHYSTLANNPITTVNGSNEIVFADVDAVRYRINDRYVISGATTTNGVPNGQINTVHVIRNIGTNTITVRVATAATSSGTGGGNAVVRTSGILRLTKATHGLLDGQRVKIQGAANTGGILTAQINLEFIIRNVATNTFDFVTDGTATSSVASGGGAATAYQQQIDAGSLNQGSGQGYGAGLYGVGLYGTALISNSGVTYPRIWFIDRFGENILLTAGNNSPAYYWQGSTATAPIIIPNAPDDINYLFVSNNILVTFGHDVENKIFASDQGDFTIWTASSTNQVFEDQVEGAGRLISHAPLDGYNLIFTEQQTYIFKYIGGGAVWQIDMLDAAIGIISPMARVSINGIAYWMGQENFYMFRGGKIEPIPCNFSTQCSILRYVFDNLNYGQRYKIFAWYNEAYDEIWWHYPSAASNEPDRIARFNRKLQCWMPDEMPRTAAEYPSQNLSNPRLGNVSTLYTHETGNDADGQPMDWQATTKKYVSGKDTALLTQIVPDNVMTGNGNITIRTFNYPQSGINVNNQSYQFTGGTERIPITLNGRYWDYTFSGSELGQEFLMGQWMIEPQPGATKP